MKLIDHTNKDWEKRVRRINGAYTYSQDLVKYQVPHWEQVLKENDLLSTCPKISEIDITGEYGTIIQYLHSYPYYNSIHRTQVIKNCSRYKAKNIVFVSAYKDFAANINIAGMRAIFAPMGIDVKEIKTHQLEKVHEDRIIYFGNVIQNKVGIFNKLQLICKSVGLKFDYISNGRFNGGKEMSREATLKLISQYKYGIGVGRCAQELMALGVRVVIAGHKFGGLITTEEEYRQQLNTNMNGRIITYTTNMVTALKDIDKAILKANDIAQANHAKLWAG